MSQSRQPAGTPAGGRFAAGAQSRPQVRLRRPITEFMADGRASLAIALEEITADQPAQARIIWQHNPQLKDTDLPVIDVPEDTVLIFAVMSGLPRVRIGSGRVVYGAYSVYGNSVEIAPGARVHIDDGGTRSKITVVIAPAGPGQQEAVVTTAPGQQDRSSFRLFHPSMEAMTYEQRQVWRLPEVEADREGIPVRWDPPGGWAAPA